MNRRERIARRELRAQNIRPASLMKQLTDHFAKLGYRVDSREKTPGANKVWMSNTKETSADTIFSHLKQIFPQARDVSGSFGKEYMGSGFQIEVQGPHSIFISVTLKRPQGKEYEMGLDV